MSSTTSVKPLNDREMYAWRTYLETMYELIDALEDDLADQPITIGEYQVLVYLSEAPQHSMRMIDLARALHLSPSGLTRRLDGLVANGLVERVPSRSDRRVMLAVMTEAGMSTLESAYPAHLAGVRHHIIDRLTPEEVDVFGQIFARIQAGLCENAEP